MTEIQNKTCINCRELKAIAAFQRDGRGGHRGKCRVCRSATHKVWREANKEKQALYRRRFSLSTYGLTEEEYDVMLAAQGGGCAMCGKVCRTGRQLAVDHDHLSGRVRGLLCVACNQALGVYEAIRETAERFLAECGEGNPHISHGTALAMKRSTPRAGSRGRSAHLTDDTVREIRARYAGGDVTQRALACEYGVSQNAIGLILRRKTWLHVEDECSATVDSSPWSVDKRVNRARRITADQIAEARRLQASGASYRSIAAQLGVHHTTVMRLLTGKHSKAA
ncbi:endonuclease domain-containing protein [Streptomyces sp. NBC_00568]|uniref:endonuclease domain-containing protein n=1 Tax=Streptomyces sp. NBC_00568 TaxID=2975779 RepID=UPI002257F77C|nr:endonuclease domain-containing protein [Streptomyces sp. NBC_00568]MCX4993427.1 endonuclease domain-containing protein [Streptomyces sp. NBC_00568]